MAQKRMFSKRITNSARFLKMPISSQALYFHLNMHADDDGVVEAYTVLKYINSSEDDLRVLITKGFIKILNEEDLITHVTDWLEHNNIRSDRKVDSMYKNLLLQIEPETKLIESRPRADTGTITKHHIDTGRPLDSERTAQIRLVKDSVDKDSINETEDVSDIHSSYKKNKNNIFKIPSVEEVDTYMKEINYVEKTAEYYIDYYTARGWMLKHGKMKDWKSSIRTWKNNKTPNYNKPKTYKQPDNSPIKERTKVDQSFRNENGGF